MHWSYKTTSRKSMHDCLKAMNQKATSHAYPRRKKYTKIDETKTTEEVLYLKLL